MIRTLLLSLLFSAPLMALGQVPLPDDVKIVAPSPEMPRSLAMFVGKWSGNWSGRLASILIVEEINEEKASIIYAWGDSPEWKIEKGKVRNRGARVIPGDKPEIRAGSLTLRMGGDQDSLIVTRVTPQTVDTETFKKVAP